MLDPLTAPSIAWAVVQFTDFGIKLASNAKETCESADGVLTKNAEYKTGGRFWKTVELGNWVRKIRNENSVD